MLATNKKDMMLKGIDIDPVNVTGKRTVFAEELYISLYFGSILHFFF